MLKNWIFLFSLAVPGVLRAAVLPSDLEVVAKKSVPLLDRALKDYRIVLGDRLPQDAAKTVLNDKSTTFTFSASYGHGGGLQIFEISKVSGVPKVILFDTNEYHPIENSKNIQLPFESSSKFSYKVSEMPLTPAQYVEVLQVLYQLGTAKIYQYREADVERKIPSRPHLFAKGVAAAQIPTKTNFFGASGSSSNVMFLCNYWLPGDQGFRFDYAGYIGSDEALKVALPLAISKFINDAFPQKQFQSVSKFELYHSIAFMNAYLAHRSNLASDFYWFSTQRFLKLATQFSIDRPELRQDLLQAISDPKKNERNVPAVISILVAITKRDFTKEANGTLRPLSDVIENYRLLLSTKPLVR